MCNKAKHCGILPHIPAAVFAALPSESSCVVPSQSASASLHKRPGYVKRMCLKNKGMQKQFYVNLSRRICRDKLLPSTVWCWMNLTAGENEDDFRVMASSPHECRTIIFIISLEYMHNGFVHKFDCVT